MVITHLVHFCVQDTTWWWSESSSGLIFAEELCIGFIVIVALVGSIWFIHLFLRHQQSALPVMLSNSPAKLTFGGVSPLGIIDCQNCHQWFIYWRLKILIWRNYQLIFVSIHAITNLFEDMQVSFPHIYYRLYMCASLTWFHVVLFIIWCIQLAY